MYLSLIHILSAIGVGLLAFISQSFGAENRERAKRASGQAVLVVLVVGISFTIVIAAINKQVPVWMQVDEDVYKRQILYKDFQMSIFIQIR